MTPKENLMKSMSITSVTITVLGLCFVVNCLGVRPCHAASGAGLSTADFLTIVPDPRSVAMGGGSVADISDAPSSAMNNPASLLGITRPWASFSYIALQEDLNYNFASFAVPTAFGNIGGSVGYLSYGDIPGYDNSGTKITLPESHDVVAVMSYALPLRTMVPLYKENGAIGVNVKFLQDKLADYSAESVAVDVGGIYKIPYVDGLSVGAAYKNFGSSLKYVTLSNPLPTSLGLGTSYRNTAFHNIAATLDFQLPDNGPSYFSTGLSISPVYAMNLRAGWVENPDSPFSGFRAGIGLDFGDVTIDYAFTPAKYFSSLHHIGVKVAIGDIMKLQTANDYYLEQHFRTACEYYYRKDYIEARQRFEEILSLYPNHHPSQKFLEKIAVGIDQMEQKKAEDIRAFLAEAEAAMAKRDFLTANSCYNKILAIEPDQNDARNGQDQLNQMIVDVKLEKTREKNRAYIKQLWKQGLDYFQKGDFVKSKERFSAILDIDPENEESKKYIVDIDNQLTKIAASQVDDLYTRASELYRKGKYDEALRYFGAVSVAAPQRMDAQDFVVQCQTKIREQKAKERAEIIASQQAQMKDDMSSTFGKGLKSYEKGNYEEALKNFTKSQELAEKYEFQEYLDNTKNYLNLVNAALAEQHYQAGFEHFRRNRLESAAREYRKALQYNADNTSARVELDRIGKDLAQHYYELGMGYFGRGENDKAREMFQESLTYQPDKAESLRALERLK
jgi:tetratricopeptide (TPR) repeat protein